MTPDTFAGRQPFPPTRYSVVRALGGGDPEIRRQAWDALVVAYWKPVYKYVRVKWQVTPADAADVTQDFFARALEKDFFGRYDPARARFRTFLRTCLDGFMSNARKAEGRLKRGGGIPAVPLDFDAAEGELRREPPAPSLDVEAYFHREWVRSVLTQAIDDLRAELEQAGKGRQFQIFQRYDLAEDDDAKPTYAEIARELGVAPTDVTNHLAAARRAFRRVVLERLRGICGTEAEFESEARHLLRDIGA